MALLDLVNACPVQLAARVSLNDLAKQVGTGLRGGIVHYPLGLGSYLSLQVVIDRWKGKRPRRPQAGSMVKDISTRSVLRVMGDIDQELRGWIANGWKNVEEVKP